MKDIKKTIDILLNKIEAGNDAGEAMHYSQAVSNLANAERCLKETDRV